MTTRLIVSGGVVLFGIVFAYVAGFVASRRLSDSFHRYYARKVARYSTAVLCLIVLALVWRPFGGQLLGALAIVSAGIAFAMQEVIGAIAGWFNITIGGIFRVGDRIKMGGVHGDVVDVSLLRTKLMEIGSPNDEGAWVKGRQYTGRIVTVSNKATFTDPVFNYSAVFDYVWEEFNLVIPHGQDWQQAKHVLDDEVVKVASVSEAMTALKQARRKFPIPAAEVQPRVFMSADADGVRLTARFIVPLRTGRPKKDELSQSVYAKLAKLGVQLAPVTAVELRSTTPQPNESPDDPPSPG